MDKMLQNIQKLLKGYTYSRDIEDIVFDYNGHNNFDKKDCPGKHLIERYNEYAVQINNRAMSNGSFSNSTKLEQILLTTDTRYFSITYTTTTTYYFKEFIIIHSNSPTYKLLRHYFTPDVLLFLKHFHRSENTEKGMTYIKQNPHYFKHHTVDSIEIFRKVNNTIQEIIDENIKKSEYYEQLKNKIEDLEIENQKLRKRISEIEEK
jgi:hypothetical protein